MILPLWNAGLFGFVIEMIIPALLVISSRRKCIEKFGGTADTPYGWRFSQDGYAYGVLAFAAVASLYAIYSLAMSFGKK